MKEIEFGIPSMLVILVKMSLENTYNKVNIQRKMSCSAETVVGLMLGDALYKLLLNLHMEKVISNVTTNQEEKYSTEQ